MRPGARIIGDAMVRQSSQPLLVVGLTVAGLVLLLGGLIARVGQPFPGFFVAPDFRVFPAEPSKLEWGDRILSVDGRSPLTLETRVAGSAAPIRYEIERAGRRATVDVAPVPFTWSVLMSHFGLFAAVSTVMLVVGTVVFARRRPLPQRLWGPVRRFASRRRRASRAR